MNATERSGRNRRRTLALASAMLLCLTGAFWPTIVDLIGKWSSVPEYSHGYIVPLIAAGLLWARRGSAAWERMRPNAWGIAVLAAALLLRHFGAYFYFEWFEQLSLVFCVPGIVLLVGGLAALKWSWPACVFLLFMVPLPYGLEVMLRGPLRDIGTVASTFVMQTVGMPAYADGNVIVVNSVRIGVAEACSGLRMLMVFFALSTAVAILVEQPLWRRIFIIASAVPIALVSNIARITSTGSLYALGYGDFAHAVFHDLAGWLMMVLALILLWIEIAVLDRLVIEEIDDPSIIASPLSLSRNRPAERFRPAVERR